MIEDKALSVERDPNKNLFVIRDRKTGGSVPDKLKGHFSDRNEAIKAIEHVRHNIKRNAKSPKRNNSRANEANSE